MAFWPESLLILHPKSSPGPVKEHFYLGEAADSRLGGNRLTPWPCCEGCANSVSLPGFFPAAVTSFPPWPHLPCPSPQGPWACGFPSICTVLKLYKRPQRRATARPAEPKTGKAWMPRTGCLRPSHGLVQITLCCPLSPQPHLRGHYLLYWLSGSGHRCGSHSLVPPADSAG